jgi:hypothetical protein
MKIVLASLLLIPAVTFAATIDLPVPPVGNFPSITAAVTGFTPDGNYVLGQKTATFVSGGVGLIYKYQCVQLTWDLSGNLVNMTKLSDTKCPKPKLTLGFANSGGYKAYTQATIYPSVYYPVLLTP